MAAGVIHLVSAGPLLAALPIALAAGALSFFSPCCLPLIPGYLGYLGGLAGADDTRGRRVPHQSTTEVASPPATIMSSGAAVSVLSPPARPPTRAEGPRSPRAVFAAVLFVLGFAAVFVSYGALFGGIGFVLQQHQAAVNRTLGVVTIVLGLVFAGALATVPGLHIAARTVRLRYRPAWGLSAAPVLGALFAVGWTPCIGPTLAAVLLLSSDAGTAGRGAVLAFTYALGLGVPFVLIAAATQRAIRAVDFARRHARAITRIGGAFLVTIGFLELTGAWAALIAWVQVHLVSGTTLPL